MKAVFIIKQLSLTGAPKMLTFVANAMAKEGHDVTMVLYAGTEIMQPLHKNIKVWNQNIQCTGVTKHFKMISRLKKVIAEIAPDVIVSFLCFPNLYATIIGRMLRIPVIISERGNPYTLKGLKNHIMYSLFNLANGAVFQTEGARAFFNKRLQKRSCVIPNPVVRKNNIKFDISTDNHEIIFVARFENVQKRQDLMVVAFEKVLAIYPDAILKFYGTGEDLKMIQSLVKNKGLENNVCFLGYSDNPEEEMVKSEVFVLTSDYEGIPNTLIEAMSVGMPVVSTDCDPGGAKMLIEDGVNGILVPKNDAQCVADAIIRIFKDKELREKLSYEAYKITDKYPEEKIARQWLEYIKNMAKK